MSIVIGGVSFNDITVGFLASAGRYWAQYDNSEPQYNTPSINAPGVNGTSQLHLGFVGQSFIFNVFYVGTSYADCMSLMNSDLDAWADKNKT
ncbi:MAG: hypothetical protein V3T31_08060, partial [candidate division Zixibacteria bacterium]